MFERFRRARAVSLLLPPLIVALLGWVTGHRVFDAPALSLSLIAAAFIILAAVLVGGIRLDDLGINRDYLGRGLGATAMIWGAAQVLGVLPRVVANRAVVLNPEFEYGSRWDMGVDFLNALASATALELAFRGFLLVQLYLAFRQRSGPAVIGTVFLANLAALPATLPYPSRDVALIDQATRLVAGLLLCWIYLRTRNLFLTIGIHALLVAPIPIMAGPRGGGSWFHPLVIAVLATGATLLWPRRD